MITALIVLVVVGLYLLAWALCVVAGYKPPIPSFDLGEKYPATLTQAEIDALNAGRWD